MSPTTKSLKNVETSKPSVKPKEFLKPYQTEIKATPSVEVKTESSVEVKNINPSPSVVDVEKSVSPAEIKVDNESEKLSPPKSEASGENKTIFVSVSKISSSKETSKEQGSEETGKEGNSASTLVGRTKNYNTENAQEEKVPSDTLARKTVNNQINNDEDSDLAAEGNSKDLGVISNKKVSQTKENGEQGTTQENLKKMPKVTVEKVTDESEDKDKAEKGVHVTVEKIMENDNDATEEDDLERDENENEFQERTKVNQREINAKESKAIPAQEATKVLANDESEEEEEKDLGIVGIRADENRRSTKEDESQPKVMNLDTTGKPPQTAIPKVTVIKVETKEKETKSEENELISRKKVSQTKENGEQGTTQENLKKMPKVTVEKVTDEIEEKDKAEKGVHVTVEKIVGNDNDATEEDDLKRDENENEFQERTKVNQREINAKESKAIPAQEVTKVLVSDESEEEEEEEEKDLGIVTVGIRGDENIRSTKEDESQPKVMNLDTTGKPPQTAIPKVTVIKVETKEKENESEENELISNKKVSQTKENGEQGTTQENLKKMPKVIVEKVTDEIEDKDKAEKGVQVTVEKIMENDNDATEEDDLERDENERRKVNQREINVKESKAIPAQEVTKVLASEESEKEEEEKDLGIVTVGIRGDENIRSTIEDESQPKVMNLDTTGKPPQTAIPKVTVIKVETKEKENGSEENELISRKKVSQMKESGEQGTTQENFKKMPKVTVEKVTDESEDKDKAEKGVQVTVEKIMENNNESEENELIKTTPLKVVEVIKVKSDSEKFTTVDKEKGSANETSEIKEPQKNVTVTTEKVAPQGDTTESKRNQIRQQALEEDKLEEEELKETSHERSNAVVRNQPSVLSDEAKDAGMPKGEAIDIAQGSEDLVGSKKKGESMTSEEEDLMRKDEENTEEQKRSEVIPKDTMPKDKEHENELEFEDKKEQEIHGLKESPEVKRIALEFDKALKKERSKNQATSTKAPKFTASIQLIETVDAHQSSEKVLTKTKSPKEPNTQVTEQENDSKEKLSVEELELAELAERVMNSGKEVMIGTQETEKPGHSSTLTENQTTAATVPTKATGNTAPKVEKLSKEEVSVPKDGSGELSSKKEPSQKQNKPKVSALCLFISENYF